MCNGEKCDKCGEVGEDRRTLWMACFYAMDELSVPFKKAAILGRYCEQDGEKELPMLKMKVPEWGEPQGDEGHRPFFTLRVCKRCRGEWMAAINAWYKTPVSVEESCGSGIFVRDRGSIREITREEWDERERAASDDVLV